MLEIEFQNISTWKAVVEDLLVGQLKSVVCAAFCSLPMHFNINIIFSGWQAGTVKN